METPAPLPSLIALRAFEAAARLGSFQGAAEVLHLTPSAVSHQIRSLEVDFGQPLFLRRHRRVELTEAGRRLQVHVARGFDELRRGAAALRQDRRAATLRVSSAGAFATAYLAHRLEAFEAQNPGLQMRLELSQTMVDFEMEPVDVGIRLGFAAAPGLFSEVVLPIVAAPVCAPPLAARLSRLEDLADLTRISISQDPKGWRAWYRAVGLAEAPEGRDLWFDNLMTALQAGVDGVGVVLAPLPLVAHHLTAGRLVTPFPQTVRSKQAYRLVCRRGEETLPKIERFRRWLKRELAEAVVTSSPPPADALR
ncbi:MAG: LysR substrate-binding domain-containing protein [Pseudomonadota bacterium]